MRRDPVFLLDDHEVVRRGIADLLDQGVTSRSLGKPRQQARALARVPAVRPDVAVLDVRLPTATGSPYAATCAPSSPTCAA